MRSTILCLALFLFCSSAALAQKKLTKIPDRMVRIPKTVFTMGTEAGEIDRLKKLYKTDHGDLFSGEVPAHRVSLSAYFIDKYEVTNKQFAAFLKKHSEWQPAKMPKTLDNGKYLAAWPRGTYPKDEADFPVTNVNWYAATAYCTSFGKRLPTEAQWENAARGGLQHAEFPWGNGPADPARANYGKSGFGKAVRVGSYPANGYGIFDMAGNVWEFTADEWGSYSAADQIDPLARMDVFAGDSFLSVTTRRVLRGGSWGGSPINLRVAYRDSHPPTGSQDFVGFRCAMPANLSCLRLRRSQPLFRSAFLGSTPGNTP